MQSVAATKLEMGGSFDMTNAATLDKIHGKALQILPTYLAALTKGGPQAAVAMMEAMRASGAPSFGAPNSTGMMLPPK